MKRRAFVVGLMTAPWFIRRAFADASIGARPTGTAATKTTRPTLVLVVPRDENARWERGAAFGDWLNHADDAELAPLATVDVLCAPAADYGVGDEPLLLFVVGATVRRLNARLPKDDPGRRRAIAALVRQVLPHEGELAPELAAVARQRYVKKAPRGARWGRTTMCGNEYEEGPAEAVDCGMGHVGKEARRFLDFYTAGKT